MKKKIQKIITLSSIFLLVFLNVNISTGEQQGWIIDGDTIFLDDDNVYLSVTPHTLIGRGWVEFELMNKRITQNADIVFGFDTNSVKVSQPQIWKTYNKEIVGWHYINRYVNVSFVDVTGYTNIGIENYENYNDVTGTENNSFLINLTYDNDNKNVILAFNNYWEQPDRTFFELEYNAFTDYLYTDSITGWQGLNKKPQIINYLYKDMTKIFQFKNINVNKNQLYKIRVYVEPKVSTGNFKYWYGIKPSSETLPQAIANDHFYAIDPWGASFGSWNYRKQGYVQQSQFDATETNFPVFINVTDNDVLANAQPDGDDIVFTASDGETILNHELVNYNSSTGHITAWVNFTSVASGSNTSFYIYYGNAGSGSQENVAGTWHSDYILIYHLNTSTTQTGGVYDSSNYGNHGTYAGDLPTDANINNGDIAGQYFDGTGDYILYPLGAGALAQTSGTHIFFMEHTDDASNSHDPITHWDVGGTYRVPVVEIRYGDNKVYVETRWTASATSYLVQNPTTQDTHYYIRYQEGEQLWGWQGIMKHRYGSLSSATFTSVTRNIGANQVGSASIKANLYEYWIYNGVLSLDYLESCYNMLINSSTSIQLAGEEELEVPLIVNDPPVLSFENPTNNSVDQNLSLTWNVTMIDKEGDTINWTIECFNLDTNSGSNDINGSKILSITGLIYSQLYTIWVNASDGYNWTNATYFFTTIRFTGEGREIIIYATDFRKGSDSPTDETLPFGASGNLEIFVMSFDPTIGGNDEELFFKMHMPWDLDNEFNVEIHLIWFTDDWDGGVYNWDIEYLVKNESIIYGGDYNTSTGTPFIISENVTPLANNQFIETLFSAGIDANVDQMIYLRLSLDKSMSNATKDAHLAFLEVKYFNVSSDTSDIMEIETTQFTLMINLVLFFFFFYIGYVKTKKRSGGAFMILSGFMLFAIEASLLTYISAILVLPLISPFAIFILFLGGRKWLYPTDGDKAESEGS